MPTFAATCGQRRNRASRKRFSLEALEPRLVLDSTVVFNEIMYNPAGAEESTEWIELHNQMGVDMDISGWRLNNAVDYTFPVGTVIPGRGYLVVATDLAAFENATGVTNAFGPYVGFLDNGGEKIELLNNNDREMDFVDYGDSGFWPVAADGSGATLAKLNPNLASEPEASWAVSSQIGGTPGEVNFITEDLDPVTSTIITTTSEWSYEDTDTILPADWNEETFVDDAWATGLGPLFAGEEVVVIEPNISLVGYWNFDDNVDDQSTAGNNDGVLVGAAYNADVPTAIGNGKSILFGGGTDLVSIGADTSLNSSVFTLSYWLKNPGQIDGLNPSNGEIGHNRVTSRAGHSFETAVANTPATGGQNSAKVYSPNGGWANTLYAPPLDTWTHMTWVSDGASVTLYANGINVANSVRNVSPSGVMYIAGCVTCAPGIEGFSGHIDDVALWNVALDATEIGKLADGTATPLTVTAPDATNTVTTTVTSNLADWSLSTDSVDGGGLGTWIPGADPLPDISTYTLIPTGTTAGVITHINNAADSLGATGLLGDANVHYYRTTFDLNASSTYSANIQLAVDNGAQVYLNGELLATETSFVVDNWAFPLPSISIAENGNITTTKFDSSAANFANWQVGENEIVIALRNPNSEASPAGGLAFKMEIETEGAPGNTQVTLGPTTHYFRHEFEFNDDPNLTILQLSSLLDDGAVFYLNGEEILRENMPAGAVNHSTFASTSIDGATFNTPVTIPTTHLVQGINVLAVEVHQAIPVDPDMVFAAQLTATVSPPPPADEIKVLFNEAAAATDTPFWIELVNDGPLAIELGGYSITSSDELATPYVLPAQSLASGGLLVLDATDLGFSPVAGDKLFLKNSGNSVLDGIQITNRLRGRSVEHDGRWLWPSVATPDATNQFDFETDIVINEIQYHARGIPGSSGTPATFSSTTLFDYSDNWLYNQAGDDLGTGWYLTNYSEGGNWTDGPGLLAFEDEPLPETIGTTLIDPALNAPYVVTYYFEKEFTLTATDLANTDKFQLFSLIDDGAVLFINGFEFDRFGMAGNVDDPVAASTFATKDGEAELFSTIIPSNKLVEGVNRISVEVHQTSGTSSDIVFGARLLASILTDPGTPAVPFTESDEQWIELYNHGAAPVDLTGWEFSDGINYEFVDNTMINPGEYLVVAKDAADLLLKHPGINVVGDFSGKLSRSGERIELRDAFNNPADVVEYFDEGKWHEAADGGGSTLELRDADADNSVAEAWAASDESGHSTWQTITYRGIASASSIGPDNQWKEFHLGLLDAGEVLIDDIQVTQDPDGVPISLLQNGTFESDVANALPFAWRLLGTHGSHGDSVVVTDPDDPLNQVLHIIATGPSESIANHIETTFAGGASISNGTEYEITYRAKVISGSNLLNTRLYFNRLARTTSLNVPALGGTPGAINSQQEMNIGPTYDSLIHGPVVPTANQAVTVSVNATDPDSVANMTLWYSVAGGSFVSTAMTLQGSNHYVGTIPGQTAGTVVQFYIEGEDSLGAISTFPAAGADSRALIQFDDDRAQSGQKHNLRMIMTQADSDAMLSPTNVMSNDRMGSTIVYDENTVYYDVGVRIKGSERGRHDVRMSFNLRFQPDELFRGVHSSIALDRSGAGDQTSQKEILVKHIVNSAGSVPGSYDDLVHIITPNNTHTGSAMLMMARYNDIYLDSQYKDGSDGLLYEYELVYYPTSTTGGLEDPKLYYPTGGDGVLGTSIRDMGDDQENYRHTFLQKNNRERDDYQRIIEFAKSFDLSGSSFTDSAEDMLDVDEWLRAFAVTTLAGIGDSYTTGAGHNLMLYVRPEDNKIMFFPHDMDFSFSAGASSSLVQNGDLGALLASPKNRHTYYGHIEDIVSTTFNSTYMTPWVSHYDSLLPAESLAGFASYIATRSTHALNTVNSTIAPITFEITTNGGNPTIVNAPSITLDGNGWVNVREIRIQGNDDALQLTWPADDQWQAVVPLDFGPNSLILEAYDFQGNLIASDTIDVESTVSERPLEDFLRITELNYNPDGSDDPEFIELKNISSGPSAVILDLTGVQITEGPSSPFNFTGSNVTSLSPGEFVLIVKNQAAFNGVYGTGHDSIIAGQFAGSLSNGGEEIKIIDGNGAIIEQFTYEDGNGVGEEQWHPETDGRGFTLVVKDATLNDDLNLGTSWRSSAEKLGSPGEDDPMSLSADFDGNGTVNAADLAILLENYGLSSGADRSIGDANHDQKIGLQDLLLLKKQFGDTISAPPAGAAAAESLIVMIEQSSESVIPPADNSRNVITRMSAVDRTFAEITIPTKEYEDELPIRKTKVSRISAAVDQILTTNETPSTAYGHRLTKVRAHRGHKLKELGFLQSDKI